MNDCDRKALTAGSAAALAVMGGIWLGSCKLKHFDPALVWYVLRKYLHDNQTALIFDLEPGVEVDSHPVYRYRFTMQPTA